MSTPRSSAPPAAVATTPQARGREHRSEPRVEVVRLAYVTELGVVPPPVECIARVLDESILGAGLLLPRRIEVGAHVEVRVRAPGGVERTHAGVVVHGEPGEAGFFRVGVRFDDGPESVKSEEERWPT